MAGLKKIHDQGKFRRAVERAADKLDMGIASDWQIKSMADDAYEDDGCLHIERHGLHIAVGFGQDTPGQKANEQIRGMMAAVGLKRKIGKRVLVEEECEACDGEGHTDCDAGCGCEIECDNCDGNGFTTPDDYK